MSNGTGLQTYSIVTVVHKISFLSTAISAQTYRKGIRCGLYPESYSFR
jgi:hypothetical protein